MRFKLLICIKCLKEYLSYGDVGYMGYVLLWPHLRSRLLKTLNLRCSFLGNKRAAGELHPDTQLSVTSWCCMCCCITVYLFSDKTKWKEGSSDPVIVPTSPWTLSHLWAGLFPTLGPHTALLLNLDLPGTLHHGGGGRIHSSEIMTFTTGKESRRTTSLWESGISWARNPTLSTVNFLFETFSVDPF